MRRRRPSRRKEETQYNRDIKIFLEQYPVCPVIKYVKGTNVRTNQVQGISP